MRLMPTVMHSGSPIHALSNWHHAISCKMEHDMSRLKGVCCQHRYNKAKDVLQSSSNVRDLPHAHWLLGDALYELGELSQAELHYRAVQVDTASKAERMHSLQQLKHIFKKQGDTENAANCTSQLKGLHI